MSTQQLRLPPPPERLVQGDPDTRRYFETLVKLLNDTRVFAAQLDQSALSHGSIGGVELLAGQSGDALHIAQSAWTALSNEVVQLADSVNALSAQVSALSAQVSRAESDVVQLSQTVASLTLSDGAQDRRMDDLEAVNVDLAARLDGVDTLNTVQNDRLAAVEDRLTAGGL